MIAFDNGLHAKERHNDLLREAEQARRTAGLPRPHRRELAAVARLLLSRWRTLLAGAGNLGTPAPRPGTWRTGDE
jgi:hypothetical protein